MGTPETVRPEKGQPARGGLASPLVLFGRWRAWRRRLQTRQALRHLSDGSCGDIGLSRAQARTEVERPFWTLVRGVRPG